MEAIVFHDNQYGEMNWDTNTVVTANGLLKNYTSLSFLVAFIVTMSIIKPISIKLQFGYYDIVKAYSEVKFVIDELTTLRSNDGMLHLWYVQAEKLAEDRFTSSSKNNPYSTSS